MPFKLAIFSVLFLLNCTLYSQNKTVFAPPLNWVSLEEARLMHPDSVLHLNLSKSKITSANFPSEIYQFSHLESLSLSGLKLQEIPDSIVLFKHLKLLNISKNKLNSLPIFVCELEYLELLIANKNQLIILPYCMGNLKHLKYLDLWETGITSLPDSMSELEDLKYIDLQGVNINKEGQNKLITSFPFVKFELDPPCNCFH
jgi:Leucine-rich repeat (LRR) protein